MEYSFGGNVTHPHAKHGYGGAGRVDAVQGQHPVQEVVPSPFSPRMPTTVPMIGSASPAPVARGPEAALQQQPQQHIEPQYQQQHSEQRPPWPEEQQHGALAARSVKHSSTAPSSVGVPTISHFPDSPEVSIMQSKTKATISQLDTERMRSQFSELKDAKIQAEENFRSEVSEARQLREGQARAFSVQQEQLRAQLHQAQQEIARLRQLSQRPPQVVNREVLVNVSATTDPELFADQVLNERMAEAHKYVYLEEKTNDRLRSELSEAQQSAASQVHDLSHQTWQHDEAWRRRDIEWRKRDEDNRAELSAVLREREKMAQEIAAFRKEAQKRQDELWSELQQRDTENAMLRDELARFAANKVALASRAGLQNGSPIHQNAYPTDYCAGERPSAPTGSLGSKGAVQGQSVTAEDLRASQYAGAHGTPDPGQQNMARFRPSDIRSPAPAASFSGETPNGFLSSFLSKSK